MYLQDILDRQQNVFATIAVSWSMEPALALSSNKLQGALIFQYLQMKSYSTKQ